MSIFCILNQAEVFETAIAVSADNDVVVDGDGKRFGGADDLVGHVDIGL